MTIDDFESYFDSYSRRSPLWEERVKKTGNNIPGLTGKILEEFPDITKVDELNFPKIQQALEEECAFRGVEIPACYVDKSKNVVLGCAVSKDYSIIIDHRSDKIFTPKEMRALIAHELKHLYQGLYRNRKDSIDAEFDCDRAAVSSTDYDAIRSYVDKAISMMIEEKVPIKALRSFIKTMHEAFPSVIAEYCYIPIDKWHPSAGSRMQAMKNHASRINSIDTDLPWNFP